MDPACGRIVNISSSAGCMWLYNQDESTKEKFTNPDTVLDEIIETVEENKIRKNYQMGNGYDLSKAGLNALSMIQGKYCILDLNSTKENLLFWPKLGVQIRIRWTLPLSKLFLLNFLPN